MRVDAEMRVDFFLSPRVDSNENGRPKENESNPRRERELLRDDTAMDSNPAGVDRLTHCVKEYISARKAHSGINVIKKKRTKKSFLGGLFLRMRRVLVQRRHTHLDLAVTTIFDCERMRCRDKTEMKKWANDRRPGQCVITLYCRIGMMRPIVCVCVLPAFSIDSRVPSSVYLSFSIYS